MRDYIVNLGPFWLVFMITLLVYCQGCSNEGEFARNEKPTRDAEEQPTVVVVVRQAPTENVTVPDVLTNIDHPVTGCDTCCYTIEEIQAAISRCRDVAKKNHAICMLDHLFENHAHLAVY